MDALTRLVGMDAESKKKAADDLVLTKQKELADAKTAAAALGTSSSGTITNGEDSVNTGGRRKKTRRGGRKARKSRRSRK